ncbi:MAG: hypothetical protein ABI969_08230 [bacterium]
MLLYRPDRTPRRQRVHGACGCPDRPVKVVVPLLSGEKRTILILDNVGGGVRT